MIILDPGLRAGIPGAIQLDACLSHKSIRENIAFSSTLVRNLCHEFDEEISPLLNELAGTKGMRFAFALAGHPAFMQAVAYLNLVQALRACISKSEDRAVVCPDILLDQLIHSKLNFNLFVQRLFPDASVSTFQVPITPRQSLTERVSRGVLRLKNNPAKTWRRLRDAFSLQQFAFVSQLRECVGTERSKRILMFSPSLIFHELGANFFREFNLLFLQENSFQNAPPAPGFIEFQFYTDRIRARFKAQEKQGDDAAISSLLIEDIAEHLSFYLWNKQYLAKLIAFRQKRECKEISLGIWSIPPVFGFASLIFEHLISQKIPVIGNQHGGPNGHQHHLEMLITDLMRCTDFVTWGCTKEDILRTFPNEQIPCKIHPLGTTRMLKQSNKPSVDFDLLFPMTNTFSMLNNGMMREAPCSIIQKQERLLSYLDGLINVRVAVKPFPNANLQNCGTWDILKEMHNAEVFHNISLTSFIEMKRFSGVIIEFLSTPLYEVLDLDVEIFLCLNYVQEIESVALKMLEKRVYCFYDIESMIETINQFLAGKLAPRRDNSFYHHFVSRPGAKENFRHLVKELLD